MTEGFSDTGPRQSPPAPTVERGKRRWILILWLLLPLVGLLVGLAWWRDEPVRTAERTLATGDAQRALQTIEAFLSSHPDHLRGNLVRGRALCAVENWAEAARLFSQTGADSPADLRAWGESLVHLHQFRSALPVFERLVDLQPEHAENWESLTLCRYRAGDFAAALDIAATLARLPGRAVHGWFQRGVIHRPPSWLCGDAAF